MLLPYRRQVPLSVILVPLSWSSCHRCNFFFFNSILGSCFSLGRTVVSSSRVLVQSFLSWVLPCLIFCFLHPFISSFFFFFAPLLHFSFSFASFISSFLFFIFFSAFSPSSLFPPLQPFFLFFSRRPFSSPSPSLANFLSLTCLFLPRS